MIESIFEEIVVAIALACGGVLIGFFRKMSNTQKDLCNKVTDLQKALVILCTALDRQTNRLHDEANSDLQDLVRKILSDKE